MKRNNNHCLNYYQQCINRKKLEISNKEKEITDCIYRGAHYVYYQNIMPPQSHYEQFRRLHKQLMELYTELFELEDKYLDMKGQEGVLYVK